MTQMTDDYLDNGVGMQMQWMDQHYFFTSVHAQRRLEPRSIFDPSSSGGSELNGVQDQFCSERRWCNANYGWSEFKVDFELGSSLNVVGATRPKLTISKIRSGLRFLAISIIVAEL